MMTKHTSRTRAWLLATLTIPVYICALFLFSTKVVANEASYKIQNVPNSQTSNEEFNDSKKTYYQNATFIIEDENGKKVTKTFAELTAAEKSILVPPPRKPNFQKPGKALLNDLKNKEKFAIWLDGKAIDNEEVSRHTIVHHTKSFVYKNARSKRFPQSYQVQLYTEKGFQAMEQEFGTPLAKGTVIHINLSNKHIRQIHQKDKATPTKNIQNEIAEINELSIQYTDRKSDKKAVQSIKDIVVKINEKGRFLVNYEHSCSFDELDNYIKQELRGILHKKARTALIIFDNSQKDKVQKVKKVLADNTISHISTMDAADIPPPPPPPAKPEVVRKEWKKHNPVDVMNSITKGLEVKTMIIDGKKYSYVIKNGRKYIFDKNSRLVNDKGELLPPPPPPPPAPKAPKNKN